MNCGESQPSVVTSRRRRYQFTLRSLLIVITAVAILLGLGSAALQFAVKVGARVHMNGITRELEQWAVEESKIRNDQEAFHAIDMLAYIQDYYVPGDGYRSDADTEAALQSQRKRTMAKITEALEQFTGVHYGDDLKQWEAWRKKRQMHLSANPRPPQPESPGGAGCGTVIKK
jgi:hypothetical protein